MSSVPSTNPTSQLGEPAWEIATLFPAQGGWSLDEYLALDTNHLVEFSHGRVEVLPMPTEMHQMIVAFLYESIKAFVAESGLGKVLFAPLKVRLSEDVIREPDVLFMKSENNDRRGNQYWTGADMVVEVVSNDDPDRDWKLKRVEYAAAGISEYWIVDPRDESVTVFTLPDGANEYTEAGKYRRGERAASLLLSGLQIDVTEVFSQQ